MKVLSYTQPYATAVAIGLKKIETRGWKTSHRGWIGIHAAKGFPPWARQFAQTEHSLGRMPAQLPLGAIIGFSRLVDIRRTEDLYLKISALERIYGDYGIGRFGWIMENAIKLEHPVPAKGALSLWEWEPPPDVQEFLHFKCGLKAEELSLV
jgi:hypothetical protein